ncbi:hypothetical protein BC826DRAFT_1103963 [Russula brevipes]|nr:hypothetical protein BC826DRAFT_1103963 [Russula brevipes]
MLPTPSSSRSWWSRSSVLSSKSSSSKQQPFSQGNKFTSSKKFHTIATAIGFRPKKTAAPVEEPISPVLPLHTGDIESPRTPKSVVTPVSVAVGWTDPRSPQPEEFIDAYPQSVFSTDLDPFAAAAKYPDGPPDVSDSLRFSTFSEVSTLESRVRRDAHYPRNRMSFTSSSSLSHQRSDVTSDSSPISSPLLSPLVSGRHLSRLTVESERILVREHFPSSPASPHSFRSGSDDRPYIASSPSSVTLTDIHGKGTTGTYSKARSRGFVDTSRSGTDRSTSNRRVSPTIATGCRVVVRQPSSNRLQPLRPPTTPPASELPPAPGDAQRPDFSLLPAFVERVSHSAASSSSSLSFASSASSRLDTLEAEGGRRDVRRLKDSKRSGKSRPTSPSRDAGCDRRDSTLKPSNSRREFSPTRSLKKAISIQNMPKRALGSYTSPSLSATEDTKLLKKQRSFHHSRVPMPPLPASVKQMGSSNSPSGRDVLSVTEDSKISTQSSLKSPLSSPVLSPTNVRKRLFSGTSLRRSTSSQTPEPDDDIPSVLSLPLAASSLSRPHTAIPTNRRSASNKLDLSSFWDDEIPNNPSAGNESRDLGPQHILSAADILKVENMVRDGENLSRFVSSRENSSTSLTTSNHSACTTYDSSGALSPRYATRQLDSLGTVSSKSLANGQQRTRGISLQGKVGDVMNGRPQPSVTSLGQAVRSLSFQSLNALHGLPLPPRQRSRPSTSSGASSSTAEDRPLLTAGDRSSVIALIPLSPPPPRQSATRRVLDPLLLPPC